MLKFNAEIKSKWWHRLFQVILIVSPLIPVVALSTRINKIYPSSDRYNTQVHFILNNEAGYDKVSGYTEVNLSAFDRELMPSSIEIVKRLEVAEGKPFPQIVSFYQNLDSQKIPTMDRKITLLKLGYTDAQINDFEAKARERQICEMTIAFAALAPNQILTPAAQDCKNMIRDINTEKLNVNELVPGLGRLPYLKIKYCSEHSLSFTALFIAIGIYLGAIFFTLIGLILVYRTILYIVYGKKVAA